MAFYQNIQRYNERAQSKYPFDCASTLLLDTYIFPTAWIESLNIQVTNCIFPLHVSDIVLQNKVISLHITDAQEQLTNTILLTEKGGTVIDSYSCASGQIRANAQLYPWLRGLIGDVVYGTMLLPDNALIICSQAITCSSFVGYTGLRIDGDYKGRSAILNFQRNIDVTIQEQNIRLDLYGNYDFSYQSAVKLWKVNDVDLKSKSLIIKHKALSDLRVVTDTNGIVITGVTDAT